ncbi:MAG TPA: gamma-glutamylcyclotransferase family protein [Solirubrobacterales bacterium]|nr:gamma-glutamylcyclotransferase family protein [Solirubrobacterales bacterium]
MPDLAHVFGYASLVALGDADALPGRLHGYRRFWGVAMNNWEGGKAAKHWLDGETGERPRIRVAYLDLYERSGGAVNGVALQVDATRLAALDAREINYARIEVSDAFEPPLSQPVYTYVGLDAARERCRQGAAEGNVFVSRDYVTGVRRAFELLAPSGLAEFDRTTDPLPFPERDLRTVQPGMLDT